MYRVFISEGYDKKFRKLSNMEQMRVRIFEQQLKLFPYSGKPLGYSFLREKKFNGKRLLFLVYEEYKTVLLIALVGKKTQRREIKRIKEELDRYKLQMSEFLKLP